MIQILASTPAAGDPQNPLAASASDTASAGFLALFAQALGQAVDLGAQAGVAGQAVPDAQTASSPKTGRMPRLPEPDMAANPIVLLLSRATAGEAGEAAGKVLPATDEADHPAAEAGLGEKIPDAVAQALMAMLAATPAAARPDMPDSPGQDVAETVAVGSEGETPAGKKLPNAMAVLAVQQRAVEAIRQRGEVSPAELAAPPFIAAEAELLQGAVAPAAKDMPVAQIEPAPILTGQEVAPSAVRETAPVRPTLAMQAPAGSAAWRQELADKLVWVAGRQGQAAELILNPPSLGAVEVRLNLSGNEASAQFFAANPQVREALEAALPRLRELMGSAGIALGQAMVSDQSFGRREQAEPGKASGQAVLAVAGVADDGQSAGKVRVSGTSLLDYFA